jgi:hypothetical protein
MMIQQLNDLHDPCLNLFEIEVGLPACATLTTFVGRPVAVSRTGELEQDRTWGAGAPGA